MVAPLWCATFQDGRAAGGTLADRRPHDLKTAAQADERGHMLAIDTGAIMGLLFWGALCQIIHKCSWQEKICGGASGWLTPGFLAALPIAFHCFSLGLWAAYCPLSSLIFMRFCPALGFPQLFPQLPCMAPVSVPPYANAYQMILIFRCSCLCKGRWQKSVIFDGGVVNETLNISKI